MSVKPPFWDKDDAERILRSADKNYALMTEEAEALIERIREDDALTERDARGFVQGIQKAIQTLLDARRYVEKLYREDAEGGGEGSIDFDAAREKVRLQLDRVRQSLGSKEVPHESGRED